MRHHLPGLAAIAAVLALAAGAPALAQKAGGVLRLQHFDSPASMSILEEATRAAEQPAMAVFNNLVLYDQHVAQNSLNSIVPDLASRWEWSEDGKELTFPLRQGVKWHDGKPFTAADVKCTWDLLMGTGSDKLRLNTRKSWYENVVEVTTRGDFEVTFHLKQPQPALLALLASGWSPIYPCHVPAREMRSNREVDALVDRQSRETDVNKRRELVWQIERALIEENARPDIVYVRGTNCWRPELKGLIDQVNSIYNNSRFEEVWFDR